MKADTRKLKEEAQRDISRIYSRNNSRAERRTPEQNAQSWADKFKFISTKWEKNLAEARTVAQKNYCEEVLDRLYDLDLRKKKKAARERGGKG